MKLYTYFRSSAAYRVRIALALKGLSYDSVGVHLAKNGGEHLSAAYAAVNPQMRIPALAVDGHVITQSLAIIAYLDETHPHPPLLPAEPLARAQVRAAACLIACDIHPLNNSGVLAYLRETMQADEMMIARWYGEWIRRGFAALETMVEGPHFCFGEAPTLADICLVPQMVNAHRFNVDVSAFAKLNAIHAHCSRLEAFTTAAPEHQPDAE